MPPRRAAGDPIAEIADADWVDVTQVRLLRLTLPTPDVVERLGADPRAVLETVTRRRGLLNWIRP